ncbi:MAG: CAP domain-containing protein [Turicibacter sp.]|nr:CAP domain-containing protein [Turicibacter sp.]
MLFSDKRYGKILLAATGLISSTILGACFKAPENETETAALAQEALGFDAKTDGVEESLAEMEAFAMDIDVSEDATDAAGKAVAGIDVSDASGQGAAKEENSTPSTPSTPKQSQPVPTAPKEENPAAPAPKEEKPAAPAPVRPVAPTPEAPAPVVPAPEAPSTGSFDQQVAAIVFDLTNQERANNGMGTFSNDGTLKAVAQEKSVHMANLGYFSHNAPDGTTTHDWLRGRGWKGSAWGENIANFTNMGSAQATAQAIVQGWMNSPGHRANILSANFGLLGVGIQTSSSGRVLATQVFGR